MNKQIDNKAIEEMAKVICQECITATEEENCQHEVKDCMAYEYAKLFYNAGYTQKVNDDEVVISKREYERMKSLYEESQSAYMTSSIGDLPLTVEGLRRAVDEIDRLIKVQLELQDLNIKYYNDAKDLKRKHKETAREILQELYNHEFELEGIYKTYDVIKSREILKLAEKYGVEVE